MAEAPSIPLGLRQETSGRQAIVTQPGSRLHEVLQMSQEEEIEKEKKDDTSCCARYANDEDAFCLVGCMAWWCLQIWTCAASCCGSCLGCIKACCKSKETPYGGDGCCSKDGCCSLDFCCSEDGCCYACACDGEGYGRGNFFIGVVDLCCRVVGCNGGDWDNGGNN